MKCHGCHHLLVAWAEEELDEALWIQVTDHLRQCPSCHREAEALAQIIRRLRDLKADLAPPVPACLSDRIGQRRVKSLARPFVFVGVVAIAFAMGWKARGVSVTTETVPIARKTGEGKAVQRAQQVPYARSRMVQKKNPYLPPRPPSVAPTLKAPAKPRASRVAPRRARHFFPSRLVKEPEEEVLPAALIQITEWEPVLVISAERPDTEGVAPYRIEVSTFSPVSQLSRTLVKEWREDGTLATEWSDRLLPASLAESANQR